MADDVQQTPQRLLHLSLSLPPAIGKQQRSLSTTRKVVTGKDIAAPRCTASSLSSSFAVFKQSLRGSSLFGPETKGKGDAEAEGEKARHAQKRRGLHLHLLQLHKDLQILSLDEPPYQDQAQRRHQERTRSVCGTTYHYLENFD